MNNLNKNFLNKRDTYLRFDKSFDLSGYISAFQIVKEVIINTHSIDNFGKKPNLNCSFEHLKFGLLFF